MQDTNNTTTATTTVQPLLEYFNRLIHLNNEEIDLLSAKFHPHLFLKKQFALQHGNVCDHFCFIVRGCLRMYDDLIDLYIKAPIFDRIFRVLLENHFMYEQERLGQLFSSTAEERYQSFLQNHPSLVSRLSQVQIAAYLGVTPEFLNRIRHRIAKGEKIENGMNNKMG